jgi:hypothetical protein
MTVPVYLAHAGSCASGGGAAYKINGSLPANATNTVFFYDAALNATTGGIIANAANDGNVSTSPSTGIESFLLFNAAGTVFMLGLY